MFEDFAFEDPALHADDAIGGLGFGKAVVDVGAQGVERHAAFAVPFHAGDFGAAETARDVDPDALGAKAHGGLDRALHGPAESDTALELLGDVFGHQLGVGFRLADFDDVQVNFTAGDGGDVGAQLFNVRALLADDHARARGVDGDAALLVRTLDDNARDAGLIELVLEHLADPEVLVKQLAVLTPAREPARIPGAVDTEAKPDRIDFLTHQAASPSSRTTMVISENGFWMREERPRAREAKRFIIRFLPT